MAVAEKIDLKTQYNLYDIDRADDGSYIALFEAQPGDTLSLVIMDNPKGQPVVRHPNVRYGQPTVLWDLVYAVVAGSLPPTGRHAVPKADADGTRRISPGQCGELTVSALFERLEVVTSDRLSTEAAKKGGQKPQFTPTQVRQWRRDHAKGVTIRQLAADAGVTVTTMTRALHGATYWYA